MFALTRSLMKVLLLVVTGVCATELTILTGDNGAICRWVQAKPNNDDSYIKLLVDETTAEYKIPGLIFNYEDIVNFALVPIVENFTDLYPTNKSELYPKMLDADGQFVVDAADGHSVDTLGFWNGVIDKEIIFPVADSGIYCVYIAPDPIKVSDFELPVHFQSFYGNLDYSDYLSYKILQWNFIVLVASIAALQYFLRVKDTKGSRGLTPVEAVSNTLILLTLIPYIVEFLLVLLNLFIQNNLVAPYQKTSFITIFRHICYFVMRICSVFDMYVALLFSMGLGVIYYYNDDAPNYRKFPLDWFKIATSFLLAHVLLTFLLDLFMEWGGTVTSIGTTEPILTMSDAIFLFYMMYKFDFFWFILSVFFYFKTKKRITTAFSPNSDIGSTDNIVWAFKWTALAIWIIPFLLHIFETKVMYPLTSSSLSKELDEIMAQQGDRAAIYESLFYMQWYERIKRLFWYMYCLRLVFILLPLSATILIWIRSSSRPTAVVKIQ